MNHSSRQQTRRDMFLSALAQINTRELHPAYAQKAGNAQLVGMPRRERR